MKSPLLICAGTGLLLTGCSKEPAEQYRLSQDQLAWQGYQAGKVIRFGNSNNANVRTYTIISVQDEMEKQFVPAGALPLPRKEPPLCQHLTVKVQRTDSTAMAETALDLELYLDSGYDAIVLRAEVGWDNFYPYVRVPLDELNKGLPIDTVLYPKVTLLPSATFGSTAYLNVLRAKRNYPATPGRRATRVVYYAKGQGLVAFSEDGTRLWYRIP